MAVLNQLTVSGTTYDLNDKRISTTAVTTATHLLTCNSGVTSIAPITAANLASVLGGPGTVELMTKGLSDYDALHGGWYFCGAGYTDDDRPENTSCFVLNKKQGVSSGLQIIFHVNANRFYIRFHVGNTWTRFFKYTENV